jgi:uncharacterized protein YacL
VRENVTNKLWRSVLTIRFVFTLLLAGMTGLFGWYSVGSFLRWVANDLQLTGIFGKDESSWVAWLYKGVFITVGGIFGFALGGSVFRRIELMGERLRVMSVREKLALTGGMIIGIILTAALSIPIILIIPNKIVAFVVALLVGIAMTYLSTVAALSMKEEIRFYMPPSPEEDNIPKERYKILDTNVIIDGRVADIARAGFIEGPIYIPGFVLDELQHIADSSDALKRNRGRRGLDILDQMQKDQSLIVRTFDRLAPGNEEVDARLVRLAKALESVLVTNDWNLNKVAGLQGVQVLNINELANALKPVVLPGEDLQVTIVKDGKEPTQGVGYLDDGTMIVVANGRSHMGETVAVRVTSLMQTVAGKMIFAQLNDSYYGDDDFDGGNNAGGGNNSRGDSMRSYSRGGARRPVRRDG